MMDRIISTAAAGLMAIAAFVAGVAGDSKAAGLLAQARAAIGREKPVANVRGLSCTGTLQRLIGDRQVSGELSIAFELPDKMLRTDSISPMGDGALVVTDQGINGDTLLRRTATVNAPPGLFLRVPPAPLHGTEAEAQALRSSRAELARFALVTVLASTPSMPLDFEFAGEAESPDGRADVLRVAGPSGFAAQLFLDKSTHRPLMLTYRGVAPQIRVQTRNANGPPLDSHGDAETLPRQMVDIEMYVDDYRPVDGVLLPHHISRAIDGQTNEEWTCKTIRLNPVFKADMFAVK